MNRVTCPYCSRCGISVSLYADSATCPECDLIFGVEVEVYAVTLPESERTEPEKPPAPVWPTTDDPEWIQIGDRFWVTDGAVLLRADCPALPSQWDDQYPFFWKARTPAIADGIRTMLHGTGMGCVGIGAMRFHPRFAAILQATEPVPDSLARTVGGQVVAVVMPLFGDAPCPSVDSRGQP